MSMIRTHRSQKSGETKAPRVSFSGAFLLAGGLSISLITAMTGFTLAMTMIWRG
jgi:hypothetical protein